MNLRGSAGTIERRLSLSTRVPPHWSLLTALALASALPASAWWGDGHGILTRAAVLALPQQMPAFFRAGAETAAHMSCDPDLAKNPAAPHLAHAEAPEHRFDPELLQGHDLPDERYAFLALCQRLGVAPEVVGLAPYAIAEHTERLAVAFAEHRRWPENAMIQSKCLVYAGILAHYAEDLAQPLHATVHHDGRTSADGSSPHMGIHEKVDAIVERLRLDPADLARQVRVAPIAPGELFAAIRAQVVESAGRVDRVYELAGDLDPVTDAGRAFAQERALRAVSFTASLYLTAWRMSEQVRLPGWLQR